MRGYGATGPPSRCGSRSPLGQAAQQSPAAAPRFTPNWVARPEKGCRRCLPAECAPPSIGSRFDGIGVLHLGEPAGVQPRMSLEHVPLAGLAVLDQPQRAESGDESRATCDDARRGRTRCASARSVIMPGGLLNSSMTACSVGEPIARSPPDPLSPTTAGLDDARVALSLQQEHCERVRRLPRFARQAGSPAATDTVVKSRVAPWQIPANSTAAAIHLACCSALLAQMPGGSAEERRQDQVERCGAFVFAEDQRFDAGAVGGGSERCG
jgi:hypothetical protein